PGRGLELGCSIGVLTERLAGRCDELVAVDIAPRAVAAARERLAGWTSVTVEERDLPAELPAGPWDLIMASEVLYYWDADLLRSALDALVGELADDGRLVAVHWTEPTETYPLQGDEVHTILRAHPGLRLVDSARRDHYRVDVLAPAP
ncbi:MAG TPA: SAM-dependent methyltransferase, partial [Solirubrobacteraceae bacterium]